MVAGIIWCSFICPGRHTVLGASQIPECQKRYSTPVLPNTFPWPEDSIACYCTKTTKVKRCTLFCSILELTESATDKDSAVFLNLLQVTQN